MYVGKIMMAMEVSWKRRRGSPKRKWLDNTRNDLSERELSGDVAQCRVNGRSLIRNVDPTTHVKGCACIPIWARPPADNFVIAGPIRHCLLRAWAL